jgi:hypothetical protein
VIYVPNIEAADFHGSRPTVQIQKFNYVKHIPFETLKRPLKETQRTDIKEQSMHFINNDEEGN